MRRRVYWLLPDVASARATMEDLLLAGVSLREMHFVGREDCDLCGLQAAGVLQTSDVVRSAEAGLVAGAGLGGLLGAFVAAALPAAGEAVQWHWIPLLVVTGALFDAWTSSMIGISAPNKRLQRFEAQIERGSILLIIDVPLQRIEEIEAGLQALHPEARFQGAEPGRPAFP